MTTFTATPIERVRDYWDQRPCNIRHSPAPVGTREYFDQVEARKYFVEPHIPLFADFARWQGKRVLEIGCGLGTDTISFLRAGAEVTAVDLSQRSLDLARQRAELFGLSNNVQFYLADAERLSEVVPPAPYDLVYSFGVIHHTPHPERVIEQVRRHFAVPGQTTFKLMVYHRQSWKVAGILASSGWDGVLRPDAAIARQSEAQTGCPVTYTYSRRTVQGLLAPHFQVTDAQVDHIFPYRVADYVQYRYVKEWYIRALPSPVFRWLEQQFGWHLCVTAAPV